MNRGKRKMKSPPLRGRNSKIITDLLRKKILEFDLRPGEIVDEVSMAIELGVSRTPIREALIRLAAENLVDLIPNRGAQVASINLIDAHEVFELLEVIQGISTRWAALRRTDREIGEMRFAAREYLDSISSGGMLAAVQGNFDFHMIIARSAKNAQLAAVYSNLLSRTFRLGLLTLRRVAGSEKERRIFFHEIRKEHDDLVDAIEARNGALAERLARDHARGFLARVSRVITDNLSDLTGVYDPHEPLPRAKQRRPAEQTRPAGAVAS